MTPNRGPQGDPGETGETGETGRTGDTGDTGPRGQSFSRLQVLTLAGFAVFSMVTLAWIGQRGQDTLRDLVEHERDRTTQLCEQRRTNTIRSNAIWAELADIERENPYVATSPQTVQRRIDLYEGAVLLVPECETP